MRTYTSSMTTTVSLAGEEYEAEVEYSYTPGTRPTPARYDCGGEPGDPPEVEILGVTVERDGVAVDALGELDDSDIRDLEERVYERGADCD